MWVIYFQRNIIVYHSFEYQYQFDSKKKSLIPFIILPYSVITPTRRTLASSLLWADCRSAILIIISKRYCLECHIFSFFIHQNNRFRCYIGLLNFKIIRYGILHLWSQHGHKRYGRMVEWQTKNGFFSLAPQIRQVSHTIHD